jgi:hypothetical protein
MRPALLALLVACGSSGPGADWSNKPLTETATGKVNGFAFKLKLPAGMKLEPQRGNDISMDWKADVDDYFSEPSVQVLFDSIPAKDIAGLVEEEVLGKRDVVQEKTAIPDGMRVVYHTDNYGIANVVVAKAKGATHLKCRASQAKQGGVPSPEKTLAWLVQLCMTLEIQ